MIKGTSLNGFEFEVDEELFDSWDYLEAVREAEKNPLATVDLAILTLGNDQYNKLKAFLKEKYGKLKIDTVNQELMSVFAIKQAKN